MKRQHKAWKVLAAMCGLAAAAIGISINTSGVFYSVVSQDLGMLRGTFAFHMTIFSLVTALSSLVVSRLLTRYPFKRFLLVAVALSVLVTGMMGLSSQVWQFYLLGGLRGFSTGLFSVVTITVIINHWFQRKNGLATSIALGSSGLVGATFSPLFSWLISQIGWRGAYGVEAVLIALMCLPAILYPFALDPKEEDLEAYGSDLKEETSWQDTGEKKTRREAVLALILFAGLVSFLSSMTQHLPGYADSMGLSATLGASLLSMGMVGNIISKLVVGALSDRFGSLKATLVLLAMAFTGNLLLLQTQNPTMLLIAAVLFGACYGLGGVALALVTRDIFGEEDYTKRFPIISFTGNVGAAVAFSAIGYMYDFTGSYRPTLFLLIGFLVVSMLCLFTAFYFTRSHHERRHS